MQVDTNHDNLSLEAHFVIEGAIPISPSLDMLLKAQHLILDNNRLTGEIPDTIGIVQNLTLMIFCNNKLEGPLPNITGMSSLKYLDLSNNAFVSTDFFTMAFDYEEFNNIFLSLFYGRRMQEANLSGQIPADFFSLPSLQHMVLKPKQLSNSSNTAMLIGAAVGGSFVLVLLLLAGVSEAKGRKSDFSKQSSCCVCVDELKAARQFSFKELKNYSLLPQFFSQNLDQELGFLMVHSDPEMNQTLDSEFSPAKLQSLARVLSKLSNMQLSSAKSSANFLSDPSSVYYLHPGYYTKMKAVWEEIESFQPVPKCKDCNKECDCGLQTMRNYRRENYAVRFLRGLNEQYGTVKSQIMLMRPLPTINEVFSLLTQQERQLHGPDQEVRNFAAVANSVHNFNNYVPRGRGRGRRAGRTGRGGGRSSSTTCSYCHMVGHLVDTCYHKHGFPPHFQRQKLSREVNNAAVTNQIATEVEGNSDCTEKEEKESDVQSLSNQNLRNALLTFLQQECTQPCQGANMRETCHTNAKKREPEFLEDDWHS
ncbi:putative leucine-rich repeat receptor-like protein kinase [Arachis hypogaea]|nr:putative leucine-rich repeat receptor-like protein kinase [Arachis hypogaea]